MYCTVRICKSGGNAGIALRTGAQLPCITRPLQLRPPARPDVTSQSVQSVSQSVSRLTHPPAASFSFLPSHAWSCTRIRVPRSRLHNPHSLRKSHPLLCPKRSINAYLPTLPPYPAPPQSIPQTQLHPARDLYNNESQRPQRVCTPTQPPRLSLCTHLPAPAPFPVLLSLHNQPTPPILASREIGRAHV